MQGAAPAIIQLAGAEGSAPGGSEGAVEPWPVIITYNDHSWAGLKLTASILPIPHNCHVLCFDILSHLWQVFFV